MGEREVLIEMRNGLQEVANNITGLLAIEEAGYEVDEEAAAKFIVSLLTNMMKMEALKP